MEKEGTKARGRQRLSGTIMLRGGRTVVYQNAHNC